MLGTLISQKTDSIFTLDHANKDLLRRKVIKLAEQIDNYEFACYKPIAITSSLRFSKSGEIRHSMFGSATLANGKILDIQSIVQPLLRNGIAIEYGGLYKDEEFLIADSNYDFLCDVKNLKDTSSFSIDGKSGQAIQVICYKTSRPLSIEQSNEKYEELITKLRELVKVTKYATVVKSTDLLDSTVEPQEVPYRSVLNCTSAIVLPVFTIMSNIEFIVGDEIIAFVKDKSITQDSFQRFINSVKVEV